MHRDPTSQASYWAAAFAFMASLTPSEWAAMGGLFLALLTFVINAFFQWRKDRRDADLTAAKLEALKK